MVGVKGWGFKAQMTALNVDIVIIDQYPGEIPQLLPF